MKTMRVKTTDLKPGMRLAGRERRTIHSVVATTVSGGGEFPDYTAYTVVLEQTMYAPGRGRVPQWTNFEADDLHTIYVEEGTP